MSNASFASTFVVVAKEGILNFILCLLIHSLLILLAIRSLSKYPYKMKCSSNSGCMKSGVCLSEESKRE